MKSLFAILLNTDAARHRTFAIPIACALSLGPLNYGQEHEHDHDPPEHVVEKGHDDHNEDQHRAHGHDNYRFGRKDEKKIVQITPQVLLEFGITLGRVGPGVLHEEIVLPGEIQINRERFAHATPRYAGTVRRIQSRLGDSVSKGRVLATLESTDTLRPFEVRAPFDGTVVAYDITLGQTVEAGSALFAIADLSSVWADLRIYQRDMGKIRKAQSVLIEGGHDLHSYRGTIAYIAPTVDEHTRTGLARVIVNNNDGVWKPGQFIKGNVSIEEHQVDIIIPRTALLTLEGGSVVFVQTEEGFESRRVTLGHGDADSIEAIGGLQAGESIATQNAISLKAEMAKASFSGHAGHAH